MSRVGLAFVVAALGFAPVSSAFADPPHAPVPRLRLSLAGGAGLVRIIDQEDGEVWGRVDARVSSTYGRLAFSPSVRAEVAVDVLHAELHPVRLSEPSYAVYGEVPGVTTWNGGAVSTTLRFPAFRLIAGVGGLVARTRDGDAYGFPIAMGHATIGRLPRAAGVVRLGTLRAFHVDPLMAAVGVAHESERVAVELSCGYAWALFPALERSSVDYDSDAPYYKVEDGRGGRSGLQCVLDTRVTLTSQLELTFTGHAGRQLPFAALGLAARFGHAPLPRRIRNAPPSPAYGPPVDARDPAAPLVVLPPGTPSPSPGTVPGP